MADNVEADAGSGGAKFVTANFTWSGDSSHLPGAFTGLISGAEGSWTFAQLVGGAGAVAAGVQRVTLASDDPAVTDLAAIEVLLTTIDADTGAIKTAIELLDNAVDGAYLNVNANIAGTDFVGGAGAVAAGVQRVTLASDDPAVVDLAAIETLITSGNAILTTIDADTGAIKTAVEIIDNAISGNEMQVDIVADGAGLATDAKLDTIITAVQIIDDWDETNRAKVNIIAGQAGVAAGAGAVGVTVPRVTLASDDPGVALLTTIDADTGAIKAAVELLDNAVDGNYLNVNNNIAGTDMVGGAGAVAAGVQRTTLASDDPAVAKLGTIDTSLNNLESSIVGPAAPTIDSYTHAAINLTTGANQVLASSAASKQIWVYGYGFSCGDADGQTVSLQDEIDTALTGIMEFAQYGGISVPPSGNFSMPLFKLGTDKDLEVDITGGDVDGWIAYAVVSV